MATSDDRTERTPLLPGSSNEQHPATTTHNPKPGLFARIFNIENRVLVAGFLICTSFSFTQVPLFYVFHLFMCDLYYDTHPEPPPDATYSRCSPNSIAAGAATQFSILGMSTTLFGTINLFIAGWLVKKIGPRSTLVMQTVVPAVRVAMQILGVMKGKMEGVWIVQATQAITIVGGPAGYILVTNIIAGELVPPERRTIIFGKLQGAIMLGQGLGFFVGGQVGDAIDIKAPFVLAFCSFCVASLFTRFALPDISPASMSDAKRPSGLFAPLKVLKPQKLRLANGQLKKHFGIAFLCAGIFIGVLATDYAPLLIQMYATAAFDFDQAKNGVLMAEFSVMRSVFLVFIFPVIIAMGRRRWAAARKDGDTAPVPRVTGHMNGDEGSSSSSSGRSGESTPKLPTDPLNYDTATGEQAGLEPIKPPPAVVVVASNSSSGKDASPVSSVSEGVEEENVTFDLVFLRWSLVVDGLLTTLVAYATQPWHIYLAALFVPFGSGSAPAAKGVITSMCASTQRADALNAVTLVENVARMATQGVFGLVFAGLAEVGKAYATFFCNAAIAVVGMLVLLLASFPAPGSRIVDGEDEDEEHDTE